MITAGEPALCSPTMIIIITIRFLIGEESAFNGMHTDREREREKKKGDSRNLLSAPAADISRKHAGDWRCGRSIRSAERE